MDELTKNKIQEPTDCFISSLVEAKAAFSFCKGIIPQLFA